MGKGIFIKLSKKIGKVPGHIIETVVTFFMLRGMIFYIGQRILIIFLQENSYRSQISFILAFAWVIIHSCYLAKNKYLHYIGSTSLWTFVILLVATLILALDQLLHPNIKISGTVIILIIIAIILWGFISNRRIKCTSLIIKNPKIQTDKKIIFISDLHVDLIYNRRYLKKIINKLLKEKPDFVLIWGDLINIPQENYIACFQEFQRIKVPIYAVIGNHDVYFWPDTRIINRVFKIGKITPLRNQSINIGELQLVGIDDKDLRKKKKLNTLLEECKIKDDGLFTILLTHRPIHLSKLWHTPIDLELAGHTHKFQVRGLHFFSYLINDYTYGKSTRKEKTAFISQGIGTKTPIRIGTEGEIVIINLISQR